MPAAISGIYAFLGCVQEHREAVSIQAGINAVDWLEWTDGTAPLLEPPEAALSKGLAAMHKKFTETEVEKRLASNKIKRAPQHVMDAFKGVHGDKVRA